MGLRIATNVASQTVQKNLTKVSEQANSSLEKLSSGKRINKSSDDAAGLAIATNLKAQNKGLRQATRNANDGVSMIQVAEGGMNEVSNILVRLRELTIQSASDTVGDTERGFLDKEYQHLNEEVDRIANTSTFGSTQLLNGEGPEEMDFQVGIRSGEDNKITFNASTANVTTSEIGTDGTGVASKDDAIGSIDQIDDALTKVSEYRAGLGAVQARLQSTVSNLQTQTVNQESARSVIEDADVAQESASLASANVMKNGAVAALSQANNLPNAALRLIG